MTALAEVRKQTHADQILKFYSSNVVCKKDPDVHTLLYAVFLCGLQAVIGYEQMDALFRSQSVAVHQLSSAGQGRDRYVKGMLAYCLVTGI